MALDDNRRFAVECHGNYYAGEMSSEAVSIGGQSLRAKRFRAVQPCAPSVARLRCCASRGARDHGFYRLTEIATYPSIRDFRLLYSPHMAMNKSDFEPFLKPNRLPAFSAWRLAQVAVRLFRRRWCALVYFRSQFGDIGHHATSLSEAEATASMMFCAIASAHFRRVRKDVSVIAFP